MEQWPSGQGTGFPIQGPRVQNRCVAPRLTQPFILPRSVKWVPEISGNLVVKSKLPPRSGSSLEAVEPHPQKGAIKFGCFFFMVTYIDYSLWRTDILIINLEYIITICFKKILWWKINNCKYSRNYKIYT